MSKLEQMAYKMQPAGHEESAPKRKYTKHDRRLAEAFEQWLNMCMESHSADIVQESHLLAIRYLESIDVTAEEAHGLLFSHHDNKNIGFSAPFLSAAYNKQPEKVIVFNADFLLHQVGCHLEKDKILVLLNETKEFLGELSKGAVLNYAKTSCEAGIRNKGLFVNYGQATRSFGQHTSGATINLGKIEDYPFTECEGYVINYAEIPEKRKKFIEDVLKYELEGNLWTPAEIRNMVLDQVLSQKYKMHELWDYLMELKNKLELGKDDYKKGIEAVERIGPEPGQKIKNDIDKIIERNGYYG